MDYRETNLNFLYDDFIKEYKKEQGGLLYAWIYEKYTNLCEREIQSNNNKINKHIFKRLLSAISVYITKYRKSVIIGPIAVQTREFIRILCQNNEVKILAGHVGSDHIHLLISISPYLSASKLVQFIKGNISRKLQIEYKKTNNSWNNIHKQEGTLWQAAET